MIDDLSKRRLKDKRVDTTQDHYRIEDCTGKKEHENFESRKKEKKLKRENKSVEVII